MSENPSQAGRSYLAGSRIGVQHSASIQTCSWKAGTARHASESTLDLAGKPQPACSSATGADTLIDMQGVAHGDLTVGDAVLFIALVQQLSAPLNYFGSFYRQIQTYM